LSTPYSVIGHRHAKVFMAMHADHRAFDAGHIFPDAADQRTVLLRHRIARGVGNVDHRGPGVDLPQPAFQKGTRDRRARHPRVELTSSANWRAIVTASQAICRIVRFFRQGLAIPFIPELAAM
jgi:hypothetical protein